MGVSLGIAKSWTQKTGPSGASCRAPEPVPSIPSTKVQVEPEPVPGIQVQKAVLLGLSGCFSLKENLELFITGVLHYFPQKRNPPHWKPRQTSVRCPTSSPPSWPWSSSPAAASSRRFARDRAPSAPRAPLGSGFRGLVGSTKGG